MQHPNSRYYGRRALRAYPGGRPTRATNPNRIVLRKAYAHIPGATRTHCTGRTVHTYVLPYPTKLRVHAPGYRVAVTSYMPGLGPSYVGPNPLAGTRY